MRGTIICEQFIHFMACDTCLNVHICDSVADLEGNDGGD